MKFIVKGLLISTLIIFIFSNRAKSQNNSLNNCINLINTEGYVSDGQEYKTKVDENNKARFLTTFYGGSYYRIAACSNATNSKVTITVFDTEKNPLFCNKDFNYIPYWNFKFTSTIDCIVEVEFEKGVLIKDEVMLLIGFKEK
ncbi:MAG: hypothetical protein A2W99_09245 [Bacteroidetes bacterium GWF2_33_16]|nr:MAG: hypothetical protein A2X00_07690 [Bacteroidetes bacterium GWE2_32_14]OFY03794.1 MAG: hypothetical protein A2W99_09245 [Bacteroidetes bacterium GWF2_33_16]